MGKTSTQEHALHSLEWFLASTYFLEIAKGLW